MGNIISCRVGIFKTLQVAFENFLDAGIYHAEVPPPADGDYQALAEQASTSGIVIATLATSVDLTTDETAALLHPVIDGSTAIGVPKIFVSVKAGADVPPAQTIARLQALAQYASDRGVTLCMETHPPFGTNGTVARSTISAVKRPGLRYNFDTANIYYYNENTDSVKELKKVKDLVASVHLKDTDGGFKSGNFPALGKGVVDFPTVFAILKEQGFTGPYTMEIEGSIVGKCDDAGRTEFLKQCVAYLCEIGAMD